jgi:aminopeptidase N
MGLFFERRILVCAALVGCAVGWGVPLRADGPPDEEPSVVGCGKSHAVIAGWDAEREGQPEGGVAEAMTETDVLHYNLDIELTNLNTAANTCTIAGANTITIKSKSSNLTSFTIRLRSQYNVTSALINGTTPVTVTTDSTTTRTVTLDRSYAMDEVFTLSIAYTGTTQSVGLGSIEVRSHGGTPVVATLSEPYYSYSWWPVKDGDVGVPGDNSDKATVELKITAPNNFSVAANGILQSMQILSGSRKKFHWASTSEMATYLVAFGASNYTTWSTTYNYPGGSMPVEYYLYPENDTAANRAGWEKTMQMMAVFRPLFGEYPFVDEKYGLYNFPFSGGMEHQTMTGQSSFGESLTSHELGHQWWGDNITCKTWSDIWLNEGFATYSEALWIEFKSGAADALGYFNAMQSRKPLNFGDSVYIPDPATLSPTRIFSSDFSYRKGAWVLHQLRHIVGDATFFQILADYRAAFEGKAATTEDFEAVASATYGQDLSWFFDQCVYAIGSPAYRFGSDIIEVDGQRYLHFRIEQTQQASYPQVFTMPVDVVALTLQNLEQTVTVWNDERTQRFVAPLSINPALVSFDPEEWILRTGLTTRALMIGDMDDDLDVDTADFNAFSQCHSAPGQAYANGCQPADMDGDGDVDCRDWTGFETTWTAGGTPPEFATCANGDIPATSTWGIIVMGLLVLCAGSVVAARRSEVI